MVTCVDICGFRFLVLVIAIYVCSVVVFFFKQKTAYEMLRSLVGSEMCIRDRTSGMIASEVISKAIHEQRFDAGFLSKYDDKIYDACLLYTSDAAEDLLCVDLGGRRIIKKKI